MALLVSARARPPSPAADVGLGAPAHEEPPSPAPVGPGDGEAPQPPSPSPSPPAPSPAATTGPCEFLPFSWRDLPQSWEYSFGEDGRLVAWSPDDTRPEGWRKRDDVVLKWANDAEGAKVLFRSRPLSAPVPASSRVSASATLDAIGVLLGNPRLNPEALVSGQVGGLSYSGALSRRMVPTGERGKGPRYPRAPREGPGPAQGSSSATPTSSIVPRRPAATDRSGGAFATVCGAPAGTQLFPISLASPKLSCWRRRPRPGSTSLPPSRPSRLSRW